MYIVLVPWAVHVTLNSKQKNCFALLKNNNSIKKEFQMK